jgi:hypothetical protein
VGDLIERSAQGQVAARGQTGQGTRRTRDSLADPAPRAAWEFRYSLRTIGDSLPSKAQARARQGRDDRAYYVGSSVAPVSCYW